MKHALLAASLVLVAGASVGCGGGAPIAGSPEPATDASTEDFCKDYDDFNAAATKLGEGASDSDFIKALKEAGEQFEETGTPKGISEDERSGYETFVQLIDEVDEDATQKDLEKVEEDLSDSEQKNVDAFTAYVTETCAA